MNGGLRVTLLESGDATLAHGTSQDALAVAAVGEMATAIERALGERGHAVRRAIATRDPRATLEALLATEPDVVFHLVESIDGDARAEARVAALLEWADLPYTGPGPTTLAIALDKPLTRSVLRAKGVPIPRGFVMRDANDAVPPLGVGKRWIVKPAHEDASHGIDVGSVVADEPALRERVAWLVATYAQPALVEEFVDGREFNVGLLGSGASARVLPLAEIDYSGFPKGRPRLITYAAKWVEDSDEYQGSMPVPVKDLHPALEKALCETALAAYAELGLAGYGRVDLRVCHERGPLVLDVNPNPDLSPGAGFAKAAARAEIPYEELVERIVRDAVDRRRPAAAALAR